MEQKEYKASIYNYWKGKKLFNDYTDSLIVTTPQMREVFALVQGNKNIPEELMPIFEELLENRIFVGKEIEEEAHYHILKADIDVNTHCNASCVYCPQSTDPRPKDIMPLERYKNIVDKIKAQPLKWVALHIYGEPLLDTFYKERVRYLTENGLKLYFFTNATLLSKELIDFLSEMALYGAMFNFPSVEKEEWKKFTRLRDKQFEQAKEGIEYFISKFNKRLDRLEIVVNGNSENHAQRTEDVYKHFSRFGEIIVNGWESNSRAGNLSNNYVNSVFHDDKASFRGCGRVVNQLHINIDGDAILCCQDYFQKIKLGNILTDTIDDIMNSDRMTTYRRQVYGLEEMPIDFLCRSCTMIRKYKEE